MPGGRPTKYKPEYTQALIEFFDQDPFETVEIPHYHTDGETVKWIDKVQKPRKLPCLVDFAKSINIGISTAYDWINKDHASYQKEFSDAYTGTAKRLQKWCLIQGGLMGIYNSGFAKFIGPNISDLTDKQEHQLSSDPKNPPKWKIEIVEAQIHSGGDGF